MSDVDQRIGRGIEGRIARTSDDFFRSTTDVNAAATQTQQEKKDVLQRFAGQMKRNALVLTTRSANEASELRMRRPYSDKLLKFKDILFR